MSVVERVEYRSAGPGQTVARRSAWIDSQVFGFSRAIRAFGVDRFKKNCNQMHVPATSSVAAQYDAHAEGDARGRRRRYRPRQGQRTVQRQPDI
ncbi:hypothetical protein HF086_008022, partial [Spodoptera exigua]